jgi:hypothetical protein
MQQKHFCKEAMPRFVMIQLRVGIGLSEGFPARCTCGNDRKVCKTGPRHSGLSGIFLRCYPKLRGYPDPRFPVKFQGV